MFAKAFHEDDAHPDGQPAVLDQVAKTRQAATTSQPSQGKDEMDEQAQAQPDSPSATSASWLWRPGDPQFRTRRSSSRSRRSPPRPMVADRALPPFR